MTIIIDTNSEQISIENRIENSYDGAEIAQKQPKSYTIDQHTQNTNETLQSDAGGSLEKVQGEKFTDNSYTYFKIGSIFIRIDDIGNLTGISQSCYYKHRKATYVNQK